MRRRWIALLATLAPALVPSTPLAASPPSPASSREMLRAYFETCLNEPADYSCLDEFWPPEKAERIARSEKLRRRVFPDLSYQVVDILVDGNRAAVRCRITGNASDTATADTSGEPSPLDLEEAYFYELRDGRIESGRVISDRMAVAESMGYAPPDSTSP